MITMSTSKEFTREEVIELLPAYVLGALEQDEMLAVDAYIQTQHEFLEKLQQIENTSSLLVQAIQPVLPPTNVKRVIMTIAKFDAPTDRPPTPDDEPFAAGTSNGHTNNGYTNHNGNGYNEYSNEQGQAYPDGSPQTNGTSPVQFAIAPYRPQTVSPFSKRRIHAATKHSNRNVEARPIALVKPKLPGRLWQTAALTALACLLLMAYATTQLSGQLSTFQTALSARQDKLEEVSSLNSRLAVEKEAIQTQNAILSTQNQTLLETQQQTADRLQIIANASRVARLQGNQNDATLRGFLYVNGPQALLLVNGLRPLPADLSYQLWFSDAAGQQTHGPLFNVTEAETPSWHLFDLPENTASFARINITIEPASGSRQPNGEVLMGSEG